MKITVDNPPLRAQWGWWEKSSSSMQGALLIGTGLKLGGFMQKQGMVAFHLKYEINLCSCVNTCFSSWDFPKPKPVIRKSPLCVHFYTCMLCNVLLKTPLEGKQLQVQSPPEHPDPQQGYPQLRASGCCQSPSFISLTAPCALPCSRIHLLTCSVKQAHHLVQFNTELWGMQLWIRTVREKCLLFSLITLTLCKKRLPSSFLLSLWVRWPDQSSWIFKCC